MWQRHLACRGEEEPIELCLTPRDLLSIADRRSEEGANRLAAVSSCSRLSASKSPKQAFIAARAAPRAARASATQGSVCAHCRVPRLPGLRLCFA
jgi:hypothetical protein